MILHRITCIRDISIERKSKIWKNIEQCPKQIEKMRTLRRPFQNHRWFVLPGWRIQWFSIWGPSQKERPHSENRD
jgi:hypothetical protein